MRGLTHDIPTPGASSIPSSASQRKLLAWLANVILIGGVLLVSMHPTIALQAPVFVLFLIGHILLGVHAARLRDAPTLALNIAMAAIDTYAIAIRL